MNVKTHDTTKSDHPKGAVIFDFDGTIADTFYTVIEAINENPSDFGSDGIDPTEITAIRNASKMYLFKEFGFHLIFLPMLLKKIQKVMFIEMDTIQPIPGIVGVIKSLKENNFKLAIVTSNTVENVNKFLANTNLLDYFDGVKSTSLFFSKKNALKDIINDLGISAENSFYVGDEIRDSRAAKAAGLSSISVTWGFNSTKLLKSNNPDYIINKPSSILDVVGLED